MADARTINQALGYEMNTIEFAIRQGVPYAIDFLNPAPDFERDRITPFYFEIVVQKMAELVIDRALHPKPSNPWPRWEEMTGLGPSSGVIGSTGAGRGGVIWTRPRHRPRTGRRSYGPKWSRRRPSGTRFSGRMREARLTFGERVHCPFLRPLFLDPADVHPGLASGGTGGSRRRARRGGRARAA